MKLLHFKDLKFHATSIWYKDYVHDTFVENFILFTKIHPSFIHEMSVVVYIYIIAIWGWGVKCKLMWRGNM
jgi:hypothetical protein